MGERREEIKQVNYDCVNDIGGVSTKAIAIDCSIILDESFTIQYLHETGKTTN